MRCDRCGFENPSGTSFCGHCAAPFGAKGDPSSAVETMRFPVRELATGTTFAHRYQIIEELGKGGMGRVYKVFDTEVKEKLALKLLNPEIAFDSDTIERFRSELRLARGVSHRHICRMFDLGREEETGAYYITMEYVPGENLKSLIHRIGALPAAKAAAIARQVTEGLAEAHRLGIIHRDLKPQNIMIDREGGARIMDFGIARSIKSKGITGAGVIVGTPEYMSPEQVDGKDVDARSDIYALGVVLFEMLTGRLPFTGETPLSVAVKHKTESPPDPRTFNPQVPESLARIVARCLAKNPESRYPGADGLRLDLAGVEESLPASSHSIATPKLHTSKEITLHLPSKRVWIPIAAVLLALLAFALWQIIPNSESARRTVAVLGFQNQTGDPSLDYLRETIPNLLITSLEQSKHLRVASWQRLRDLLRQSGRDNLALFDEEAAIEACRKGGIEAVVVGFYSKAGETFVSDIKVLDAGTREVLKSASARGEGLNSVLRSHIDALSRDISRGIGRPALKVEAPLPKISDLTTSSLEAYQYFLRGREDCNNTMASDAKKFLEKAVALDPEFAIAYLYLAQAEYQLADFYARDEALKKAMAYADRATEKERLFIQAEYASTIERNREKKRVLLLELSKKYPGEKHAFYGLGVQAYGLERYSEAVSWLEKAIALDPGFGPAFNMLGYSFARSGQFEKAEAAFARYIASKPGDPNPLDSLAELYLTMGRLDQAEARYREALEARLDFTGPLRGLAFISALREDYPQTFRRLKEFTAQANPTGKTEGLWLASLYDYLLGRLNKSLAAFLAVRDVARASHQDYFASSADWISVYIFADLGRFDEARQAAQSFAEYDERMHPSRTAIWKVRKAFLNGWIDLKQGLWQEARTRLAEGTASLPSLTEPAEQEEEASRLRLLQAEIAISAGTEEEALASAKQMKPADFPGMGTEEFTVYNIPFLKDAPARAYLKHGDLESAAAEYRKLLIVDPASRSRYLIHPLYHYRLGRILEEQGKKGEAAGEYRTFLELWKDADKLHPEPADARKRLNSLGPNPR